MVGLCLYFFLLLPSRRPRPSPVCQIAVSVEGLPSLEKAETYSCYFHDTETPASFTSTGVSCPTPDADSLPPIRHGDGRFSEHVAQVDQLSRFYPPRLCHLTTL